MEINGRANPNPNANLNSNPINVIVVAIIKGGRGDAIEPHVELYSSAATPTRRRPTLTSVGGDPSHELAMVMAAEMKIEKEAEHQEQEQEEDESGLAPFPLSSVRLSVAGARAC